MTKELLIIAKILGVDPHCDQHITETMYEVCYSHKRKSPVIVSYSLSKEMLTGESIKKRMSFRINRDIPVKFRTGNSCYIHSGMDRGHLASDASFDKEKAWLKSTYKYSNAVPMHKRVNRYYWFKAERYERFIANKLKDIRVVNIIAFDDKVNYLNGTGMAIPKGFYKVILNKDWSILKAFYYKNSNDKIKNDKLRKHVVEIQ